MPTKFTAQELRQLRWLASEGHTPVSAAYVLNRSPRILARKALQIGCPFPRLGEANRVGFHVSLPSATFTALRDVASEIELPAPRLARILLTIIARRNLWAEILDLQREAPPD